MAADIWGVLHDGTINAVEGAVPGGLRVHVSIPYLCAELPTKASHLVIMLRGCDLFEYHPYEGQLPGIGLDRMIGLQLLYVGPHDDFLSIECGDGGGAGGQIHARYEEASVSTAEGQSLSQTDLESAAARYWNAWGSRQHPERH